MPRGRQVGPGADQLVELLGNLAKAGASQYFLEIRRRCQGIPGQGNLWQRWKYNVPADDLDDVRQFCYEEGGDAWEYKIWVRDGSGQPVKGPNGTVVGPFYLPALSAPDPEVILGTKVKPGMPEDPELADRMKDIKRRRQEMEIDRQEAALEKERRRLEKLKERISEEPDEDGMFYPPYGMPPWQAPWANPMNPYAPPWQNQVPVQQKSDTAVELAKAFAPVLAAMVANNKHDGGMTMKDVVTLFMSEGRNKGLEPKDMFSFVGPLMGEMSRTMGDVNKIAMERMADSDQFWKEKLIEAAKLGGADTDEIDKWKKILGLATDTVREGARLVFGRPTILKGQGGEVKVPVVSKHPTPGLPGPGGKREENPAPPASPAVDSVSRAKAVVRERVDAFLAAQEQEMLIGSDPEVVADKLDELYSMLPLPLRTKIEGSEVAVIYESLREHNAEVVDRILKAVADDTTGNYRKWCEVFWDAVKNPPDEDGGDDDGDDGDDPEPAPAPEEPQTIVDDGSRRV